MDINWMVLGSAVGTLVVFLIKTLIIALGVSIVIAVIFALASRFNAEKSQKVKVTHLNKKWKKRLQSIMENILHKKALKSLKKTFQEPKEIDEKKKRIFVMSFKGDIHASQVKSLREEVSALIPLARKDKDEVVLRLESPGGSVMGYGLATAQLKRLKEAGLKLTICVDKVAASGGYLMACVGDRILTAPFALLGSIGVVSNIPNFYRWLQKHDVDYHQMTAGEFKRTLTMFGETTEKAKLKAQEQLDEIHKLFKNFVSQHRKILDIDKVSTGEIWFGEDALKQKLSDEILTSDEYLFSQREDAEIYEISIDESDKKPWFKKLFDGALKKTSPLELIPKTPPVHPENLREQKREDFFFI